MTAPIRPSLPDDGRALAIVPHDEDGTQRIVLTGELDVSTVPEFNKRMSELRHQGFHSIVLDLAGVKFMDSTGLSAILVAEMHARMRGQRFSVVEGPAHVNELFRLTGVDNFLEIVPRRH
jgi:anti-sigma B factor antagonist